MVPAYFIIFYKTIEVITMYVKTFKTSTYTNWSPYIRMGSLFKNAWSNLAIKNLVPFADIGSKDIFNREQLIAGAVLGEVFLFFFFSTYVTALKICKMHDMLHNKSYRNKIFEHFLVDFSQVGLQIFRKNPS